MFNRKYIFKWWMFYCHVSELGGVKSKPCNYLYYVDVLGNVFWGYRISQFNAFKMKIHIEPVGPYDSHEQSMTVHGQNSSKLSTGFSEVLCDITWKQPPGPMMHAIVANRGLGTGIPETKNVSSWEPKVPSPMLPPPKK